MGLPVTFLIGLLVVFGVGELSPPISGSGDLAWLLLTAGALPVPTMLALRARRAARLRAILPGTKGAPETLLRLSLSTSPLAVLLVAAIGGWPDFVTRWSGTSHLAGMVLSVLPVVLAEVPRLAFAAQAAAWHELGATALVGAARVRPLLPSMQEMWPVVRLRLAWVVLLALPWLAYGVALDLLSLHRPLGAFVLGTSSGLTVGFLLFVVAGAVVLPWWFRIAFGTTRELPADVAWQLRATASRMGFDPKRVLQLPTGMSAINAMMVGPVPVSRCLCLTDAILRTLDTDALTGVVAHEVGHARMGHPGLLLLLGVVMPLLLLGPVGYLQLEDMGVAIQFVLGGLAVFVIWFVVRTLAHRFELEADVASVRELGAGPCSRALIAVGGMVLPPRRSFAGRLFTLHPEESIRLATMYRYEREPEFRERFRRTSRYLRIAVLSAVTGAGLLALWFWQADWPYERAIWRFQCGDVAGARTAITDIGTVPDRWQETWTMFGEELAAATALAPAATDWASAREAFTAAAFPRAVEVLRKQGPTAARPWFALALEADAGDPLLCRQLYDYCRAVRDGDSERAAAVREVIQRRPVPPDLAPIFR
ncbi:MAG: M48 family metalloprotease [Planctomycetota bacterium]